MKIQIVYRIVMKEIVVIRGSHKSLTLRVAGALYKDSRVGLLVPKTDRSATVGLTLATTTRMPATQTASIFIIMVDGTTASGMRIRWGQTVAVVLVMVIVPSTFRSVSNPLGCAGPSEPPAISLQRHTITMGWRVLIILFNFPKEKRRRSKEL